MTIFKNLSIVFLLISNFAIAQDPFGIDWRKIDTQHFEIVFPKNADRDAQTIANVLEHAYDPVSKTLGVQPKKISIVLRNRTVIPNGYVTIAPRKSEFFLTPPQSSFLGSAFWIEDLAIHEFRHVVQYQCVSNTKFAKIGSFFFGENSDLIAYIAIPPWIWEGDATGIETTLTNSGRGRLPEFDLRIRTLLINDQIYSYEKALLGSLKDFYPDWYKLGYLTTTHIKNRYGDDAIGKIYGRAASFLIRPFPFSSAVKKITGRKMQDLYKDTMIELQSLWRDRLPKKITSATIRNRRKNRTYTNYILPKFVGNGKIIAIKSGFDHPRQFVLIDENGIEKSIGGMGSMSSSQISIRGDLIAFSEFTPDLRWTLKDYSEIVIFDLRTRKTTRLTKKTRLFSPSISPQKDQVITIEFTEKSKCKLVILDLKTGEMIAKLPNPENDFLTSPHWSEIGIAFVSTRRGKGKSISLIDPRTNQIRQLIDWTHDNLDSPIAVGDFVLFNSPHSGIDNIYAIRIETGEIFQVTSRKFGAFNADVFNDLIVFQDYTISGHDIAEMPFEPQNWIPIEKIEMRKLDYFKTETAQNILDQVPSRIYEIEKYGTIKNFLNVHSWVPWFDLDSQDLSLSLISDNLLGTMSSQIGATFNPQRKTSNASIGFEYSGFYPIFSFRGLIGGRTATYSDQNDSKNFYGWDERSLDLGVRLPLDFSRGNYAKSASVRSFVSAIDIWNSTETSLQQNEVFTSIGYEFNFDRYSLQTTPRSLSSPWSQSFSIRYEHTPFVFGEQGWQFRISGGLDLPGLFRHHAISINGGHQIQDLDGYLFGGGFFPRGYNYIFEHENFSHFSFDYQFPIWYPDWHIWSIANFQRLRAKLFYDFAHGSDQLETKNYRSVGVELIADTNLFRVFFTLPLPVFNYCYLIDEKEHKFYFTFGD